MNYSAILKTRIRWMSALNPQFCHHLHPRHPRHFNPKNLIIDPKIPIQLLPHFLVCGILEL